MTNNRSTAILLLKFEQIMKLIDKDKVVAEIEKAIDEPAPSHDQQCPWEDGYYCGLNKAENIIDTLEVRDVNSIWHNIDDVPKYNINGISDFIVSSAYGHIEGEAHSYTPEQWSAHLGFNTNREFRWAYEKDLIDFD